MKGREKKKNGGDLSTKAKKGSDPIREEGPFRLKSYLWNQEDHRG